MDGAPTGALFIFVARARRDHHAPVRPGPLSALHRGDFRPGIRADVSGSGTGADGNLSAPSDRAWRTGSRTSRGAVRAAAAGRHSLLRLKDRLRTTPLMSEDANVYLKFTS